MGRDFVVLFDSNECVVYCIRKQERSQFYIWNFASVSKAKSSENFCSAPIHFAKPQAPPPTLINLVRYGWSHVLENESQLKETSLTNHQILPLFQFARRSNNEGLGLFTTKFQNANFVQNKHNCLRQVRGIKWCLPSQVVRSLVECPFPLALKCELIGKSDCVSQPTRELFLKREVKILCSKFSQILKLNVTWKRHRIKANEELCMRDLLLSQISWVSRGVDICMDAESPESTSTEK